MKVTVDAAELSVAAALERIARGSDLEAWAYVDPTAAAAPPRQGPLAGLPFGVKDIIDVARMPTGLGLAGESRVARFDAWCVALLRAAGAVPVGKTHTTAHAYRDPAPTRNPLDARRTPGGSSAGSAAAVAAGHVPVALGTQTIGSILRPAAYCGVVGFKPSWGRIPVNGVAPFAPSLDHVGLIARDVAHAAAAAGVLIPGLLAEPRGGVRLGLADWVDAAPRSEAARSATAGALAKLTAAGLTLERRNLPQALAAAARDANLVCAFEASTVLAPLLEDELPPELRQLLESGRRISRATYVATLETRAASRPAIDDLLGDFDALIVPSADAAPPPDGTGDGTPYAPWSYFGTPAISLPIPGTSPAAIGLQLVAAIGRDARLLGAASAVEAALR